jgi:hypothetical protein
MKTIYTTLPIYDKITKQCYQRSKLKQLYPIICPLHRLPSFQWLDNGDGNVSITKIELMDLTGVYEDITGHLTISTHAITGDTYFYYNGTDLTEHLDVGDYYLRLTGDTGDLYYSEWFRATCVYDDPDVTDYSSKYLTIEFTNTCDLGDILYHEGFVQTIWFESEPMETSFPTEEKGQNNGYGQFVRTFARQIKKYLARTKEMPDYMVDVFNRMRLHDTIQITDLVGDVHDVYNLEVEHEWLFEEKYYAKLDLSFDYNEAVVISSCCSNFL